MSEETENKILSGVNALQGAVPMIKILFSGTFVIGSAIAAIAVWVYQVMDVSTKAWEQAQENETKIESLERWQIRTDLDKFKVSDGVNLDKRLSNLEQSQEQIKTALKRIEERL